MNIAADRPGTLDRIVFTCRRPGEVHLVGSSVAPAEAVGWAGKLRGHTGLDRDDRPVASMWYGVDGGAAALLRRIGGEGGSGVRCHALVGWHGDLPPELALQLHGWVGWNGPAWAGTELRRLDVACSRSQHARPHDLDRAAADQASNLVALVAAVLRDPRRPLSVASGASSVARRIALLWGLRAVLVDLLDVPGEPPFSFSTFETAHATGGPLQLRVAFVPLDAPDAVAAFPATRRVVRLPADDAGRDDAYRYAARVLVRAYLYGGTPAVRDWLDHRQVRASHSVSDRVQRVVEMADPQAPPGMASAATAPATTPAATARAATARAATAPAATAPAAKVLALADLDLTRLADADLDTVKRIARALIARRGAPSEARRAEARELLQRDRSWERRLTAALSPAEARAAVDALVRCAFQPADLRDEEAVRDIESMVATVARSSAVLNSLVGFVVEHGAHSILLEAAGLRWLRELGHPVAGWTRRPSTRQRTQRAGDHTYLHLLRQGRQVSARSGASRDV
ncbi:MAG TPA: hypothetical protein VGJ95_12580 [Pseudonocardiaceae bacterium]